MEENRQSGGRQLINVRFDINKFNKQMSNLIDYSVGFMDGAKEGKKFLLDSLGKGTIAALYKYIDSSARSNPRSLQHVYEWYQSGSKSGRLFIFDHKVTSSGLSINATFSQSRSIKNGSSEPFYNKAKIMENGIPVVIKPKKSEVLVFEDDGETIFTKKTIVNTQPGGPEAKGSFEKVFDEFMKIYFTQSFLTATGLYAYLENPVVYKQNLKSGIVGGRSAGKQTGLQWMANAKVEVA
jgi:hypothetical protein